MPVVPTHHYRETYTADAFDELAATFRIPVEHRAEMAKLLEDAAAIWRWKTAGREGQVAPFIAAKKLSDLSKQAYKLKATLDALPAAAITAFIAEMDHVESKIIAGVNDKGPFLGYMVPQSDGSSRY